MTASRPKKIDWAKKPAVIAQEKERREREEATVVVKVVYDSLSDDAVVYKEGRAGLKHQDLTDEEKALLVTDADDGREKGYFYARWSNNDVKWLLIKKAPAAAW